ncbi:hypothetical protein VSS74_12355 [Conexibacter stalactiti]|uniref:F5/8 type C domain-containing protein n=1 Tax=Conexibacter stalactiti TaxID=1940611 RepID=A0ABU4HPF6_9ACTN|nr:hypothetical protein [Conexibacter stalactiti]MDW5595134.1 hypothetical protein [Conexibacter stalactiti]MEC5035776.1 hypothetical protein [Conexibacter stalactiti]
MESSPERPCPSCSAPAQENQRWCLECGAELPQTSRRSTLKPVVGIATTLTVLVGAASAAGFTLLQDGKQPPPPATTVAQQPPPVTTPSVETPPPADTTLPDTSDDLTLPDSSADRTGGGGGGGGIGSGGGGTSTPPVDNTVPDYSDDVDTSTPNPPPPDDSDEDVDSDDGSVTDDSGDERATERRPAQPRLRETNIALGAVAVPYAPYASGDEDLGDAGAIVDGSTSTSWRTPVFEDPAAHPQLGVYVDLAGAERLTKLVLSTPTPGMSFEVYTARSGPPKSITAAGWSHVATKTNSPGKTTIELPAGTTARFVLIWVTGLPAGSDHAAISELQIFSKQPV